MQLIILDINAFIGEKFAVHVEVEGQEAVANDAFSFIGITIY